MLHQGDLSPVSAEVLHDVSSFVASSYLHAFFQYDAANSIARHGNMTTFCWSSSRARTYSRPVAVSRGAQGRVFRTCAACSGGSSPARVQPYLRQTGVTKIAAICVTGHEAGGLSCCPCCPVQRKSGRRSSSVAVLGGHPLRFQEAGFRTHGILQHL